MDFDAQQELEKCAAGCQLPEIAAHPVDVVCLDEGVGDGGVCEEIEGLRFEQSDEGVWGIFEESVQKFEAWGG